MVNKANELMKELVCIDEILERFCSPIMKDADLQVPEEDLRSG